MNADLRRKKILNIISHQKGPSSASLLAEKMNVSRQIIVGDVALLRAQGYDIIATARGYIIPKPSEMNHYIGKVVCQHSPKDTKDELYKIVDLEARVLDVIVEHNLYGEIRGGLNLSSRKEVDEFTRKVDNSEIKLLLELTQGIHTHTIGCRNKEHFEEVLNELDKSGYLYHSVR